MFQTPILKRVPLKFWNYTIFKDTMRRITREFSCFFNSKSRLVPSAGVLSAPLQNEFLRGRFRTAVLRICAAPGSPPFPGGGSLPFLPSPPRYEKKLRESFRGASSCFFRIQLIPSALSQGKPVHASCPFKSFIASRTKIRSRCAFPDNPARTDS